MEPKDEYHGRMDSRMSPEPGPYSREMSYDRYSQDDKHQMTIGFGEPRRMHYDEGEDERERHREMGNSRSYEDPLPMDEHTAKEWVKGMKNRDEKFPHGER